MRRIDKGPPIPAWVGVVVVVIAIVVLGVFAYRTFNAGGPRDPKTFPKEAYQPPGYGGSGGGQPGAPGAPGASGQGQSPYSGAYPGSSQSGPAGGGQGQSPYSGAYPEGSSGGGQ